MERKSEGPPQACCSPLTLEGQKNRKGRSAENSGSQTWSWLFQRTDYRASFQKLTLDVIALASSIVFFKTCFIFSFGAMKIKQGRGREMAIFKTLLPCPDPTPGWVGEQGDERRTHMELRRGTRERVGREKSRKTLSKLNFLMKKSMA